MCVQNLILKAGAVLVAECRAASNARAELLSAFSRAFIFISRRKRCDLISVIIYLLGTKKVELK